MTIIVVKTCDGDVYFRFNRSTSKDAAVALACEQVLRNDLAGYCLEDREIVREAMESKMINTKWKALLACGAIRLASLG